MREVQLVQFQLVVIFHESTLTSIHQYGMAHGIVPSRDGII